METVSEEVIKAATEYASDFRRTGWSHESFKLCYYAFIAGASYSKPIEHEQKPINGNGKESENNPDSI